MKKAYAASLLPAGNKSYILKAFRSDIKLNHACIKRF